ncbi:MAG TPA: retropepsin-like aspartic protease, partial [Candidatus Aquilonibacter sp.]
MTADGPFDAVARVRDANYKIDVILGSATYEFGRVDGKSWRRTPNGSVRIIRSDVQGDMLDRWPRAVFGFDPTGCTANGTMDYGGSMRDVLDCRMAGDFEHWFLVDPKTGRIVREISREGSRVLFYDFDDFRVVGGRSLPFHWQVSGADGDAEVTVSELRSADVSAKDVAIPATASDQFQLPGSGIAEIPAAFNFHIEVPVQVNGQTRTFIVDTGTSQTIVDIGEANRLGLHPQFGHARVAELRVGDVVAKNLAVEAIDVFHDNYNAGILGNEFFTGHIVHINYPAKKLELLSHAAFKPPPDAFPLKINVAEGIP